MKYGILFDLDGTLLDTLEDLTDATNYALAQFGCPERSLDYIRSVIGNGALRQITLALPEENAPDPQEVLKVYKAYYNTHCNIKTRPYPGFPTDMQPQFATMLCLCNGTSTVVEDVWDNRFKYIDQLRRMGANIIVNGDTALITGVEKLHAAPRGSAILGAAIVPAECRRKVHHTCPCIQTLGRKVGAITADFFKVIEGRIAAIRPIMGIGYRLHPPIRQ